MRTSVFVRPAEVHYITLHEDLYRICRGNACAAMLMDYFIREHDRRLWEQRVRQDGPDDGSPAAAKWSMTIQASVGFLCDILVWSYSKNTISDAVKKLAEWGMIKISKDRPKGREYDRRHYLTVDQDVVQGLFTDLSKGIMPSSSGDVDFPNSVNQLPEVGKSLEEMNLLKESGEKQASDFADAPTPETSFPKGNPPVSHPLSSAAPPPAPLAKPAPKPRPRNALLETILEVTGVDWQKATKSQWACAAKALGEIKEVDPAVTPEALRAFAAQKRNDWDKISFGPMAIAKHWGTGPIPMRTPSSEPDPFDGKPTVTRAEVNAKFGYGAESVKWLNRLHAAGRLVK